MSCRRKVSHGEHGGHGGIHTVWEISTYPGRFRSWLRQLRNLGLDQQLRSEPVGLYREAVKELSPVFKDSRANALTFWPLHHHLKRPSFFRAALRGFPATPNMMQLFPRIRRVAAAITISPQMVAVLAAAWHFAERLNTTLLVIHGGAPDAQKEAEFRDAMFQLEMPRETRIVWSEGEPAAAIVSAAQQERVDLLIAGALEGKDVAGRSFLGAVAQPLAKLARCSLLLLTRPRVGPNPFRRIVVMTDFSDCAKMAFKHALWLAEADSAELVQVISIHTPFMQARAESDPESEKPARKREEEEELLRDFVATAPACGVPVESKIVDTTTGFAACDFTQSIGAELLVVPAPKHVEAAVPSMMDWALQVTPSSLWIVRET
jgi:nucleotide-binding universal stress UspA family protein